MWTILKRCYTLSSQHDLSLIAGGVAFFGILSIFPAFAAFVAVFGIFADPDVIRTQIEAVSILLPPDVLDVLLVQVVALAQADSNILTWTTVLSLIFAVWSARSGIGALQRGLFQIGHGRPPRGFRATILALMLTLGIIGVGLVAIVSIVVLPIVLTLIPVQADWRVVIEASRWGIVLAVILAAIGTLYNLGLPRHVTGGRFARIAPGALFALAAWFSMSWGFTRYIAGFDSYDRVYGSIGAVIALLMWLYLSAFVVLIGFVLNVAISEKRAS